MSNEQFNWKTIQRHLMTGIGYMIPIIVAAGVVMGVAQITGLIFGFDVKTAAALSDPNAIVRFLAWMNQYAAPQCRDLMYVVFGAYLAYSIADRTGLVVGFFGGLLSTLSGAGFFGAVITGFAGGYLMKWIKTKIKVSRTYLPVMNLAIYPFLGSLAIFALSYFVINPLGAFIINGISAMVDTIGQMGGVLISFIIAAGTSFDIGGPVSKGFLPVAFQLADAGFSKAPLSIGSVVPAIGFGLAVVLDKFLMRRTNVQAFDGELSTAGFSGFILGALGVAEGGLPLLISDPLFMIPINCLGGGIASVTAYVLGMHMARTVPPGLWGIPLVNKPFVYIISLVVGSVVVAGLTLLRRYKLARGRDATAAA